MQHILVINFIQEMVSVLSEVNENRILRNLKVCNHMAIVFDENTDCTITKQLVIYC